MGLIDILRAIATRAHPPYPRGPMTNLIPLDNIDPALVEDLLDRAFGADRFARTAYKVRDGADWLPALSFAALDDDDRLTGTIQCWPVALTAPARDDPTQNNRPPRRHPLIMVGPVAVLPDRQREGFGQALMTAALGALSPQAPLPQVMIGDADYYERVFGFTAAHTGGWRLPGPWDPARLLCRADNVALLPREGALGPWLD